jgi:hypothetical protein
MTTTTKPLTAAQKRALETLRAGGLPTTTHDGCECVVTGVNTSVLRGLQRLGLIDYRSLYLGGLVQGLKVN